MGNSRIFSRRKFPSDLLLQVSVINQSINQSIHLRTDCFSGRGAVVGKSNSKENHLYFPHLYDVMKDYFQIPGKVTTNQLVGCTMVDGVMHIYIKMQCSST